jgi:hypothetical protein
MVRTLVEVGVGVVFLQVKGQGEEHLHKLLQYGDFLQCVEISIPCGISNSRKWASGPILSWSTAFPKCLLYAFLSFYTFFDDHVPSNVEIIRADVID